MENNKSCKVVDFTKNNVTGFTPKYERLEQKVILVGHPNSTLLKSW